MVCTQGNLLVLTPKDMILCCSISALVEAPAEAMRSNTRWSGVLASEGIVFFCFFRISLFLFFLYHQTHLQSVGLDNQLKVVTGQALVVLPG